ncbi:MAG: NnrS family protein [Kiritimatiellae bacterium]|nr:NnrS family protein [Kiritimatiellia bacterium]
MTAHWRESEPYRLLFPVGILLALIGVGLWPLFLFKITTTYPIVAHPRLMIEGFSACFILGFLGTALPVMLNTKRFHHWQMFLWAGGIAAAAVFHLMLRTMIGDIVFASTILFFLSCVAVRFVQRQDRPPPGLVTVLLGLACAVTGSTMQAIYRHDPSMGPVFYNLSRLLLNQAFLLLPVLGIAAFILPVFVGYPRRQSPPEMNRTPHAWLLEMFWMLGFGLLIIGSVVIEAFGFIREGNLMRGFVLLIFLARNLPVFLKQKNPGAVPWLTRLSLLTLPVGFLVIGFIPNTPMAGLHILYISGLALLILSVATRVITAHGGFQKLFFAKWPLLWWIFALITAAMITRVSAEWIGKSRALEHYAYAGITWIIAIAIWFSAMIRCLLNIELEPPAHQIQIKGQPKQGI